MDNKFMQTISEMKDKAARYDNLKSQYEKYVNELKEIKNKIDNLINEIKPGINISERKPRINFNEEIEYIHKLILNGTHVNSDLIEKTYPNLEKFQIYSIMKKLEKSKNITSRKNGTQKFIYAIKEI